MDTTVFLIAWAAIGGVCALAAGTIAEGRGRSFSLWLVMGLLFGPLAVLVAAALSPDRRPEAPTGIADDLATLTQLHQNGDLTDAEFSAAKRRLLD